MRAPIDQGSYSVSQGYSSGHPAMDLAAAAGVAVKAPESGVVALTNTNPGAYFGGMYVVITGNSGLRHYMGHHSAVHVQPGQRVSEGQHIANVGSTGKATGPHVHWEVSRDGATISPSTLINQVSGDTNMGTLYNQDNYYSRAEKTVRYLQGRKDFSRAEYNGWVGKDMLTLVETASDSPAAERHQENARLGELARKDNWQQQIYDRTKERNDARTEAAKNLQERNAARDEAAKAKAEAKSAAELLAKFETGQAQTKKEADNFITAVINSVRTMFGGSK